MRALGRGLCVTAIAAVALSRVARAESPPVLAALAPARNALASVPIGPSGELYEPDGHGAYVRKRATEIAGQVTSASRAGTRVIALTHDGPPFRLTADGWTVIHFGTHAKPVAGTGPRPVAALARAVYALDDSHAEPTKLPDAPAPVTALAASASGVTIETDRGLLRLEPKGWKPISGAPHSIRSLLSDRFALTDRGIFDLKSQKLLDAPPGATLAFTIASDDGIVAVAHRGKALELVTWTSKGKLASEPIPVDAPTAVVGIAADASGRAIVALRDGRLAIRAAGPHGAWTTVAVQNAPTAAHPGPPPASSP